MKIALLGYGKMGHEIEAVAHAKSHSVVATFDVGHMPTPDALRRSGAEVAIEFSEPGAVIGNLELCAEAAVPIIIGTTGWDAEFNRALEIVERSGIGCVTGSNFSIGVNLFLAIVRTASHLLGTAGYDVYVTEAHHAAKKDSPSGTALRIGEAVIDSHPGKSRIVTDLPQGEAITAEALMISSVRAGTITGTHTVGYDSQDDAIEITHQAKTRRGFAAGAVRAAEWIRGRSGLYRFEDHVTDIIGLKT